ncbi:MAG: branched-chain amino acid ABC transporter permease [Betaproteobacteria bacterium]|nr:branched-chain amino acid ABC transporter permease [Betaproteobacteria bacterium]
MPIEIIGQGAVSGLFLGGILALIALGLTLIWGVMGVLNMAHANFVMVAMFIGYFLVDALGIHPYFLLPLLIVLLFVLGMVVMQLLIKPTARVSHEHALLMTMALMIFLESAMTVLMSQTSFLDQYAIDPKYWLPSLKFGGITIDLSAASAFAGSILMALLLFWFIRKTDTGRSIRACAENARVAGLMGINVGRTQAIAFGVGIACTAAAAVYTITPQIGDQFLPPIFVIVALGGIGNFMGTLIAGFIIGVAEGVAGVFIPGPLVPAVGLGILVVVLLARPEGLFGERGL